MTPPCDPQARHDPPATAEDWARFREGWRALFGPRTLHRLDVRRERAERLAARGRGEAAYPPAESASDAALARPAAVVRPPAPPAPASGPAGLKAEILREVSDLLVKTLGAR